MRRGSGRSRWMRTTACAALMLVTSGPGLAAAQVAGTAPASGERAAAVRAGKVPPPPVVQSPIPFPDARRSQMAEYSRRHYGAREWRLTPTMIVEHVTAGNSYSSAWNTFAANARHNGEYPGTCSHFIIEANGTIHRLVPDGTRCRHTVGLNHVAIGIEMVGVSVDQVRARPKQVAAARWLTLWLMQQHGIELRNVIGHNESLEHPAHLELYPSWRCLTHADWNRAQMDRLRWEIGFLALQLEVPIGPKARWERSGC